MDNIEKVLADMGISPYNDLEKIEEELDQKYSEKLNLLDYLGTKGDDERADKTRKEIEQLESVLENVKQRIKDLKSGIVVDTVSKKEQLNQLRAQENNKGYAEFQPGVAVSQNVPPIAPTPTVFNQKNEEIQNLLRRAKQELADKNWSEAQQKYDKVLDMAPENSEAYKGYWMAKNQIDQDDVPRKCYDLIRESKNPFEDSSYTRALKWASPDQKQILESYELGTKYLQAVEAMQRAKTKEECDDAAKMFAALGDFHDCKKKIEECQVKKGNIDKAKKAEVEKKRLQAEFDKKTKDFVENFEKLECCKQFAEDRKAYSRLCKKYASSGFIQLFHVTFLLVAWGLMHWYQSETWVEYVDGDFDNRMLIFGLAIIIIFLFLRMLVKTFEVLLHTSLPTRIYLFGTMAIGGAFVAGLFEDFMENLLEYENIMLVLLLVVLVCYIRACIKKSSRKRKIADSYNEMVRKRGVLKNAIKEEYKKIHSEYMGKRLKIYSVDKHLENVMKRINDENSMYSVQMPVEPESLGAKEVFALGVIAILGLIIGIIGVNVAPNGLFDTAVGPIIAVLGFNMWILDFFLNY